MNPNAARLRQNAMSGRTLAAGFIGENASLGPTASALALTKSLKLAVFGMNPTESNMARGRAGILDGRAYNTPGLGSVKRCSHGDVGLLNKSEPRPLPRTGPY